MIALIKEDSMAAQTPPTTIRSGESTEIPFIRSGRFIHHRELWFFKTREGVNYGPYDSRTECKYAYQEFIDIVSNQSDFSCLATDTPDLGSDWKVPKINFF